MTANSNRISRRQLLSDKATKAFGIAEYRLRHYAQYAGWTHEKRLLYCLGKAFDAAKESKDERLLDRRGGPDHNRDRVDG
jgi:hypothetical protein